ncbi:Hsp20/alpha crystallin family protein [Azohydromonas caseinilytica]|uniref:Hsp20/alpha crystallin family protein n=1 Tax=Azohydromonas caseinilytica TaxID=2728836 RepID=A0A848F877_9BURK|nr:Hsp20/alpha crystallin family protein [Azohydromonas caseinilytica]NML14966.1 Hsp20/alpha crystallin family protein [Azohydromonas caseinilytica]
MENSQQQGSTSTPSSSQQQGTQASAGGTPGSQQEQFSSASAGQQGGAAGMNQGGSAGGQQGGATGGPQGGGYGEQQPPRGGNPYTDFFSRRGTSPFELLKRLDEDVERLFHQFIGGGRELLRSRMRERGGMEQGMDMPTSPAAGSSGGTDETQTEAAGGSAGASAVAPMATSGWLPQVELCERGGKLHVSADLPGLHREDLQIHFDNGQLIVQGERRTTRTTTQPGGYYRSERTYGQFRRAIPLPEGVNPDTAQASFHNGVLDVSFDMPVRHNRSRQIPIGEGGGASAMADSTGSAKGNGVSSGAGSEIGP